MFHRIRRQQKFLSIICRNTCGLGYRRSISASSIFIAGNISSRASSAESSMLEGFNCCSNHRFTPSPGPPQYPLAEAQT
jgi:hypothetical protein